MSTFLMARALQSRQVDLGDGAAVRGKLRRAVLFYTIFDMSAPLAAGGFAVVMLIVAWGVFKHTWAAGNYFLLPVIISVVGLGIAGAMMGPWMFNRHPRQAADVAILPGAPVGRADVVWVDVDTRGLLVPGGPPSHVRLIAETADGTALAWTAQARPRLDGIGVGRAHQEVATMGVPEPGNWILAVDTKGDILWPTSAAVAVQRRA